ncbi:hypothetical protein [Streptomyces sp. NPDC086766]|uniref:hypothetical protein n=1 Tax=Streptomyces sp. NPDC086766 TaxID=3365754 RepID=UPI0037FB707B
MSDYPTGPVEPVVTAVPAPVPETGPPGKPERRGRTATVAASVLAALALVGGIGFTAVTVNAADRAPGAPVWTLPKTGAEGGKEPGARAATSGLADMLLPYGTDGLGRGPDIAEFGSDAVLSGKEAAALREKQLLGLPRTQRLRLEKEIDRQRITGVAMRSYVSTTEAQDSTLYAHHAYTVSIGLVRMKNTAAVRGMARFQGEFLGALGVFRKGPAIKGHENASCFLSPKGLDEGLETMLCSAYVGEVLVSATAHGAAPLDAKGVAMLLGEQLDRIAEPGEAV